MADSVHLWPDYCVLPVPIHPSHLSSQTKHWCSVLVPALVSREPRLRHCCGPSLFSPPQSPALPSTLSLRGIYSHRPDRLPAMWRLPGICPSRPCSLIYLKGMAPCISFPCWTSPPRSSPRELLTEAQLSPPCCVGVHGTATGHPSTCAENAGRTPSRFFGDCVECLGTEQVQDHGGLCHTQSKCL